MLNNVPLYECITIISLCPEGNLSCFHILAVVNNATIHIHEQIFEWVSICTSFIETLEEIAKGGKFSFSVSRVQPDYGIRGRSTSYFIGVPSEYVTWKHHSLTQLDCHIASSYHLAIK